MENKKKFFTPIRTTGLVAIIVFGGLIVYKIIDYKKAKEEREKIENTIFRAEPKDSAQIAEELNQLKKDVMGTIAPPSYEEAPVKKTFIMEYCHKNIKPLTLLDNIDNLIKLGRINTGFLTTTIEEMSKLKMASVSSSEIEAMKEFDSEFYSLDLYIRRETSENEALQQRIDEFNKKEAVVKAHKIFSKYKKVINDATVLVPLVNKINVFSINGQDPDNNLVESLIESQITSKGKPLSDIEMTYAKKKITDEELISKLCAVNDSYKE
ncbi:MAG: hypothetical protein J5709_09375 [Bacteroidales bacterium]|nr:hypothetical protein [Bacteroidales bacterium]